VSVADHGRRLAAAGELLVAQELRAVIVPPSPDLAYLIGYEPMPLERATLLVLAPGEAPRLLVPMLERPLAADAAGAEELEIVGWRDGEDPYAIVAGWLSGPGRIAMADRLWASHVLALQAALPGATWTSARPVVGALRARKDAVEIDALRRAALAADAALAEVVRGRFVGRREDEIAADLAEGLLAHGHGRVDFTIVATGPNAASPHHEPTARTVEPGDAVVLDFGGVLDGYCSDTTRTLSVGQPDPLLAEVHAVVLEAQAAARGVVRPGVSIREVDRAARAVIEAAGYGERFFHRTGHGIGMETHEEPYIVSGNSEQLQIGHAFSIEPGIYIDGQWGARIEDIVVCTDAGGERLNMSSRELYLVD